MSRKFRYFLLGICILIFLILAPLMLLYVRGEYYDLANHRLVKTGIIATRVEPSHADIVIDGKVTRTSSGDIRFLKPREYDVRIEAPGYFTWSKRLSVYENQVTWTNPAPNKLFLFYSRPQLQVISDEVEDSALVGNLTVSIGHNTINISQLNDLAASSHYTSPKPVSKIETSPSNDELLLTDTATTSPTTLLFNIKDRTFTDLSKLFPTPSRFFFSDTGKLFALNESSLYQITLPAKAKTKILDKVQEASVAGNTAYAIITQNGSQSLVATDIPTSNTQILIASLPSFTESQILVTPQKNIFLLLDQNLYKINQKLDLITSNLTDYNFNPQNGDLAIIAGGEMLVYDFTLSSLRFITRTSLPISNPLTNTLTSHAFMVKNNTVTAMELDTRDHQNEYILYQGTQIKKFFLSPDAKTLIVQDGASLKQLNIR